MNKGVSEKRQAGFSDKQRIAIRLRKLSFAAALTP